MKNLTITVVDGGKAKCINDVVNLSGRTPTDDEKSQARKAADKSMSDIALVAYAASQMISLTKQSANYFISDIGRQNGDSNYQAQINRSIEIAKDIAGIGISAFAGAKLGAVGGPAGIAVGAIIGLVSSAANLGLRQAERSRSYAHQQFIDNNSQAVRKSRADFNLTTGRLR